MEEESLGCNGNGVRVSLFDPSVENHFKAVDTISMLCEETEDYPLDENEIQRLSSSITFIREWRHYNYKPRIVRFANELESPRGKDVVNGINLPQFSSATVPKREGLCGGTTSLDSSKDFVICVGGSVWALDWCPRVHERPDCRFKCEFIAAGAHPPESNYHNVGAPLTGRGIIQIWCVLNVSVNEEEAPSVKEKPKRGPQKKETAKDNSTQLKRPRGRPRKKPIDESLDNEAMKDKSTQVKRPRGRPRKKPIDESLDKMDCNNQFVQALTVQYPEDSINLLAVEGTSGNTQEHVKKNPGKKQKCNTEKESACDSAHETSVKRRKLKINASAGSCSDDIPLPLSTPNEGKGSSITTHQIHHSSGPDSAACNNLLDDGSFEISLPSCYVPENVALPRVMLCLAHNGKVAWDVKWQPYNVYDSKCKQRMGYLAVLLGNGSLEVWEVPLPRTIKVIYPSLHKEGTDPRFVKLEPVFRCSMLNCGGEQSIPLTVEWSTSPPYDYLIAGCHDGTVALWKFSASDLSKDTRPLLCFSADKVPIRAVAWAPVESDLESANVILTAGHGGLKFWDLRDPFRPLWDLHQVPKFIYSLDWLPDPRCVIISFDDGTMRTLSLVKAAYDVPVTGKPYVGTKQQGLHLCNWSSFAIWSVHVSRLTGLVAYSSADGTVLHFQLTAKAVEKDPSRNRPPHFLCGSLTEEESTITVNTPIPNTPITFKKPVNESGDNQRSMRNLLESNEAKRVKDVKKAKGPSLDDQALALCSDDDSGMESEFEEILAPQKSKKGPKGKSKSRNSGKKTTEDDQASECEDNEPAYKQGKGNGNGETGNGNGNGVFPPKSVAMHRVRWNMNKGSERWLCSGGAAGIVRCQEIVMPDLHKKSA